MNFEVIIGIEIHCELKTKTKMFSNSLVSFAAQVNTCANEIDLGMPGTLPSINRAVVEKTVKVCHALQCDIDPLLRFDRKNYYYSDLPKGFQITQQFYPIGQHGSVQIDVDGVEKEVRINRIHMEEDTAKQFHHEDGTYLDFNRAGIPLIEIVSEPDMRSGKEAAAYVEKIKNILFYLDVSDVKMEEGSLRCDVNISLRPYGYESFGVKTEIKNLNSIYNVQKATEFEIKRQEQILLSGGVIEQATRRYDETSKETILMRKKEGEVDYKYFPEPNILPIRISESFVTDAIASMNELPDQRLKTYKDVYGLNEYDSNLLVNNKSLSDFFNEVVKHTNEYKLVTNWIVGEVSATLNKLSITVEQSKLLPEELASMVTMIQKKQISSKQAKEVFEEIFNGKKTKDVVKEKGMEQVSDTKEILVFVQEVLDKNPQSIDDFKNGKDRTVGFLVGQVMKISKGQANPALTNQLLVEELKKR